MKPIFLAIFALSIFLAATTISSPLVYGAVAGFYPSYPWPWTQIFTLSSPSWTSGGANCTASLYYFSGKKTITLSTMSFPVSP